MAEFTTAYYLRNAHQTIIRHFPKRGAEGRRWTEDGKHGVAIEDGYATMLDADGHPRRERPSVVKLSYMLSAFSTVDKVANILDR